MASELSSHLDLWRAMAADLTEGKQLRHTLEDTQAKLANTPLAPVLASVGQAVEGGDTLSEAMAAHPTTFSQCVLAMVRAGEAGGVVDVIAARIAEGLDDGSFPLPGAEAGRDDAPRWWRAFGRLLSSGVPLLQTLDLVAAEVAGPALRDAAQALRQAVLDGQDLAGALRSLPEVFPKEICVAVALGEQKGDLDAQVFRIADALEAHDLMSLVPDPEMLNVVHGPNGATGEVIEQVNRIILDAVDQRASDIHFDPVEDEGGRVRFRVDGVLRHIESLPDALFAKMISRLKIMACMDLAEQRLPQDGRIMLNIHGRKLDLRVSLLPTVLGQRVVMRILDRATVCLDLERIGLLDDDLARVRDLCALPNGIVVCNGPVGSGKTTLLYAMLREIDVESKCVMSVEDPVEYRLDGISQTQLDTRRGLTFSRALRSMLRQDPDVVLVGEIRDLETLHALVQTALTGHLAFTTLHANTSPGAVKRLLDIGLEPFLVNSSLAGVVSQRLVRVLCPQCKKAAEPPLHSIPPEAVAFVQGLGQVDFYAPQGCEACKGTGYRGRTAIHEILVPDDHIRQAVAAGADRSGLRNAALAAGMEPMLINGMKKAARGITSIQEVCRVVPHGPND